MSELSNRTTSRREFLSATSSAVAGSVALAAAKPVSAQAASIPTIATRHPTLGEVDVLVVGGGPAGIGAALGAARKGAKTLLVENYSFFGGVASWCLGMPINQVRPAGKPRSAVHELLIEKLLALGDQAVRIGQHELFCNVDYLKVAAMDALEAAGCRYLVCLRAVDAMVEGSRLTGVVVATKNGLAAIRSGVVVDCTGDADVAYFAGAETLKEVGNLSPMTLCLNLTNVSRAELRKVNMRELAKKAREKYPLIPESWALDAVANSQTCYFINHAAPKAWGNLTPQIRSNGREPSA